MTKEAIFFELKTGLLFIKSKIIIATLINKVTIKKIIKTKEKFPIEIFKDVFFPPATKNKQMLLIK